MGKTDSLVTRGSDHIAAKHHLSDQYSLPVIKDRLSLKLSFYLRIVVKRQWAEAELDTDWALTAQ